MAKKQQKKKRRMVDEQAAYRERFLSAYANPDGDDDGGDNREEFGEMTDLDDMRDNE
jgi:hypothetical protein